MSSSQNYRVVLNQISPFLGVIDSIKIYGAIIRAISEIYGEAKEVINAIKIGKIRVSSPMPYVNGNFYMFKPHLQPENIDYKDFKKFKNRTFIREELAKMALKDGMFNKDVILEILRDEFNAIKEIEFPGVAVPRASGNTSIYYKEAMIMRKLWILLSVSDEWKNKTIASLKYIGDVGLSKKQSSGFGHFEIENVETYEPPNNLKYRMFVSRFIPSKEELNKFPFEYSRYDVGILSGYSKNGLVIPIIRYIVEGSVYPAGGFQGEPMGRVIDIEDRYSVVGVPAVI